MKRLLILLALVSGLALTGSAQSGRRLKTPAPAPTPAVEETEKSEKSGGYSESAPNSTRSIAPAVLKKDKKVKKEPAAQTPSAETKTAESVGDEDEVLKIETNLITIPVSVYERSGVYVGNLRQSEFKIFENGQEQEIAYFGTTDQPFTVVLLIDTSPSTSYKIEEIQNAAIAFVDQLKTQDKVMVIEFDSSVRVLTDFTNDRQQIYKAIRRADFGNGTSLYEAVEHTLRKKLNRIEGRKAVVLFTDGVDTTSRGADFESTLAEAEESDSIIYPVYYNTFFENRGIGRGGVMSTPPMIGLPTNSGAPTSADYARGRAYLEALAGTTGGKMFRAESTTGGLNAAFEGIAQELRSQYSIGYYPQESGEPGERRQIKVRVNRPNLAIRARDSYIVGDDSATKKTPKKGS